MNRLFPLFLEPKLAPRAPSVLRRVVSCAWALCLAATLHPASAFTLGGPGEAWQTAPLGYEVWIHTIYPSPDIVNIPNGWISGSSDFSFHPMNLGEEYRWNTTKLYYAYDAAFLDYFGSNGVAAVDSGVAVFNNLANVSSLSPDDFPLDEMRFNYTAAALHLFDLKSTVMELLIERLGLFDPERWTWALRARILPPGLQCPLYDYGVIQRNFDPITWLPTVYVNGNLFTYTIDQSCPPAPDFGDAVEFLVDADGTYVTALASPKFSLPRRFYYGGFHTGLTRDDIGGLKYIYRADNRNVESTGPNTTVAFTNTFTPQLLFPSNLTLLANQALTNNAAALQVLFPGLQITSTTNFFAIVYTTNISAYFTNFPYDPVGAAPHLFFLTNVTLSPGTFFHHTFGNIETIEFINGAWTAVPIADISSHRRLSLLSLETIVATNFPPWAPSGSAALLTNTFFRTIATNIVAGEFFIIPTNSCGVSFIAPLLTNVVSSTNFLTVATNIAGIVNTNPASTNFTFTQATIDYFTNHIFVVYPVECQTTNSIALREGIEHVDFVRRDFDSLLGRFFYPITNQYTLTFVTNNTAYTQTVFRVVTSPDILFSASDLEGAFPEVPTVFRSTPTFSTNAFVNVAGPGTMEGAMTVQFNKVGPMHLNSAFFSLLDEQTAVLDFTWASYDGSTNPPIIYPSGASIMDMESSLLMQVFPASLPAGASGIPYFFINTNTPTGVPVQNQFTGSGGQAPYSWSLAPQSPPMPPGLNPPASDGSLTGTPTTPGSYFFTVRMTDVGSRFVDRTYVITINP